MTVSLILGIVVAVGILFWLLRSRGKEVHHLDDLHINPGVSENND